MDPWSSRFEALGRLYGTRALPRLRAARVCVVGVGGVGSWTVEALARSGIGTLTLVDLDEVCVSNTNRQLPALAHTIGRSKVEVLAERVAAIHPGCTVHAEVAFLTERNAGQLLDGPFDFVVDAIDSPTNKVVMLRTCLARGTRIVTVGGAGGRIDPTAIRVADLAMTQHDPLLRRVRKKLRREHGWSRKGTWGIPAVYSHEAPRYPGSDGTVCAKPTTGPVRLTCETGYGTASFTTGAFGLAAAGVVVSTIAEGEMPPR